MINPCNRRPWDGTWLVTGITNITTANMCNRFTARNRAVMTIKATAYHLGMVHRRGEYRRPGCREDLMTGIANITTGNMGSTFARGGRAIMASNTVVHKGTVVDRGR